MSSSSASGSTPAAAPVVVIKEKSGCFKGCIIAAILIAVIWVLLVMVIGGSESESRSVANKPRSDANESRSVANKPRSDANEKEKEALARPAPESFCGIMFGTNIESICLSAKPNYDLMRQREYAFSYLEGEKSLDKPFRYFQKAEIHAALVTKKVFKTIMSYKFPRNAAAGADVAEYKDTLKVLKTKYGTPYGEYDGFGGDKSAEFKLGDVVITLRFTAEGLIDSAALRLSAEKLSIKRQAETESRSVYDERVKKDIESRKIEGGADAL
jgi:hypothetical protein